MSWLPKVSVAFSLKNWLIGFTWMWWWYSPQLHSGEIDNGLKTSVEGCIPQMMEQSGHTIVYRSFEVFFMLLPCISLSFEFHPKRIH